MASPLSVSPTFAHDMLPLTPEREAEQRRAVVAEARSWVGTPYRQLGAAKNIGVDCAMLLVRCWVDTGVFEDFDPRPYPPDWYLHHSEERYLDWIRTVGEEVASPAIGDVVVYKFGRCYSHSGIVVEAGRIVHSYAKVGLCMETGMKEGQLADRKMLSFDLWGKHR